MAANAVKNSIKGINAWNRIKRRHARKESWHDLSQFYLKHWPVLIFQTVRPPPSLPGKRWRCILSFFHKLFGPMLVFSKHHHRISKSTILYSSRTGFQLISYILNFFFTVNPFWIQTQLDLDSIEIVDPDWESGSSMVKTWTMKKKKVKKISCFEVLFVFFFGGGGGGSPVAWTAFREP